MKNVYDEIDVIEENPPARLEALGVPRFQPAGAKPLVDRVRDGPNLDLRMAGGDHEEVTDAFELAKVEDDDVLRALGQREPGRFPREILRRFGPGRGVHRCRVTA